MAEVGTVYVNVMPSTKGFAKALGGEGGSAGGVAGKAFNASFGKLIGGSALGNIISNVTSKVAGTVSSSMGSAISRVDTIANFPKVMSNLGYGADAADTAIKNLTNGIDGLPTSLDGIVSMAQQLAPMCGGLEKATDLSLAMNNMFLASGASTADQARAMQQYSQMLARGKVELNDWRTLQEVMPGQLNQVAQAMLGAGKNSTDLYEALKNGKVSMNDFNETVKKLNKEGVGEFASFEQQAKSATEGIGTAMDNMKNRTAKAIAKVIDHIGQGAISSVINNFTSKFSNVADVVIAIFDGIVSKIDIEGFKNAFKGISDALSTVFGQGDTAKSFGEGIGQLINALIPVIQALTPVLTVAATLFKFLAENAGAAIPIIITLALAFVLLQKGGALGSMLGGITKGMSKLAPSTAANIPQMLGMAAAALLLGAGMALAAFGISMLAQSAIQLVQAGPMAALALVGLVAAIAILIAVAGAVGPALSAGALGFVAFGAAILMVSVGIALVVMSLTLFCTQLPLIAAYGGAAAAALALIGAALLVIGVGAIVGGVGLIVFAAGLAILAVGAAVAAVGVAAFGAAVMLAGIGIMLAAVGVMLLAAGIMLIATGVVAAADGITSMADGLPKIAEAAPGAAAALGAFAAASGAAAIGIGAAAPPAAALAAAVVATAAGLTVMNAQLMLGMLTAMMLAAGINSASSACTAAGGSFQASGATMAGSFDSIQGRAESAMNGAVSAVRRAAAQIAATKMQAQVEFRLGKMPHFSMVGKFDAQTGETPSINVNWYGGGGIFRHPSIIGVGEAGTEVVENVDRLDRRIRKAVRDEVGGGGRGGDNYYIYTNDPELVAAKVSARRRRNRR